MAGKKIFSVCGMCTVRCPIQVEVSGDKIEFLQGNPNVAGLEGGLCARGSAGLALIADDERPQYPMIRAGERGEGKWRRASWDEALDYTAERLKDIMARHGSKSVLFSDRGGPFRDLHQAFLRGLGSPNYSNHDSSCARNVMHAAQSVFGFGRKDVVYDLKNARHVVLQTRNIFESINVKEANDMMTALGNGCKLTVIDIRANLSAMKADRFFLVRPGTDYALNLAVIRELLDKKLHDMNFTRTYIEDLEALQALVEPCTLDWAEAETGIEAARLADFVKDLAEAKPAVIWHPGWMTARYRNSFYISRSIYIINALLGAIGAKGGLPLANKPGDVGKKGPQKAGGPGAQAHGAPGRRRGLALRPPRRRPRPFAPGLQGHGDRGPLPPEGLHRLPPRPPHGLPRPGAPAAHLGQPGPPGGGDLQLVGHRLVRRRGPAPVPLPGTGKHPGRQKRLEALFLRADSGRWRPASTPGPTGKSSAGWPSAWGSSLWPLTPSRTSGITSCRIPDIPSRTSRPPAWSPSRTRPSTSPGRP